MIELSLLTSKDACMGYYNTRGQLLHYIEERAMAYFKNGDLRRDLISSIDELNQYRSAMREKFIELIGGLPECDSPLHEKITGTIRLNGFSIEKIIFESRPENYVTCNLYLPDNLKKPTGAVLFLCGHSGDGKHYPSYQRVCQTMVKSGLIVLAMDPIGQGERSSYYDVEKEKSIIDPAVADHDYAGSQSLLLGHSIARYFIHDAMRAIDYLVRREEVDETKIGVTGSSGGGTQTCMMMICDQRIKAAVPTNFVMNRQSYLFAGGPQDAEQLWPGFTQQGFDHEDFLICMAPKPVLVNAVAYDFFPIEGTVSTFKKGRRFYRMYDKQENLQLFKDQSRHTYTALQAEKAAAFFFRHLLGIHTESPISDFTEIAYEKLWCTKKGQVKADFPDARFIYDENISHMSDPCFFKKDTDWLKQKVCNDRSRCDLNIRCIMEEQMEEFSVKRYLWWSQQGLFSHALTFRNTMNADEVLPVTIAVFEGGTTSLSSHMKWIEAECEKKREVLVLDVTGTGCLEPYPVNGYDMNDNYGTMRKLADELIWMGDSLPAMRIYDIIRTLDAIAELPQMHIQDIHLYASGRFILYGQLACKTDNRIIKLETDKGAVSLSEIVRNKYYDDHCSKDLIIPGILRHVKSADAKN
ncbi:MAG: acetylxylan esterase [Clostridia bacterium]|nr:acetylxylan esterase [Clostridia bacterium]